MEKGKIIMRKTWAIFLLTVISVVLASCGNNDETRTFEMSESGVESTLVYTYSGDEVISQSTENKIDYETLGIDKAQAEEAFAPYAEEYEGLAGVQYAIEFEDDQATESISIVYDELNYEEIQNVEGIAFEGDPAEGISMERSAEMLLNQGYTEVEE